VAIITQCSRCRNAVTASASACDVLCETCMRKDGWKPWEEMTTEEKVEELKRRLDKLGSYSLMVD